MSNNIEDILSDEDFKPPADAENAQQQNMQQQTQPGFFNSPLGQTTAFVGNVGSQLINDIPIDTVNTSLRALNSLLYDPNTNEHVAQIPKIPQMMPGSTTAKAADWTALGLELAAAGRGAYGLGKEAVTGLQNLYTKVPQQLAEKAVNAATKGRDPQELSQDIATAIRQSRKYQASRVGEQFQQLKDEYGGSNLYAGEDEYPYISKKSRKYSEPYKELFSKILATRDANAAFIDEPNFANAHDLQSALGDYSRDIRNSINSTQREKNLAKQAEQAKRALRIDIGNNFIRRGNQTAADRYHHAIKDYKENVVPYDVNDKTPRMYQISHGEDPSPDPSTIHQIFHNPENKPFVQKILSHIGSDLGKDVVGLRLASEQGSETPGALAGKLYDMYNNEGYKSYMQKNHNLMDISSELGKRVGWKENAGKVMPQLLKKALNLTDKTKTKRISETLKNRFNENEPLKIEHWQKL